MQETKWAKAYCVLPLKSLIPTFETVFSAAKLGASSDLIFRIAAKAVGASTCGG
jgi:hypothetical protein